MNNGCVNYTIMIIHSFTLLSIFVHFSTVFTLKKNNEIFTLFIEARFNKIHNDYKGLIDLLNKNRKKYNAQLTV